MVPPARGRLDVRRVVSRVRAAAGMENDAVKAVGRSRGASLEVGQSAYARQATTESVPTTYMGLRKAGLGS